MFFCFFDINNTIPQEERESTESINHLSDLVFSTYLSKVRKYLVGFSFLFFAKENYLSGYEISEKSGFIISELVVGSGEQKDDH